MVTQPPDNAADRDGRTPPPAYCTAVKVATPAGPAWRITVVSCPLCGKEHGHGGGTGARPALGTRASHCGKGAERGVYVLRAAPGAPDGES